MKPTIKLSLVFGLVSLFLVIVLLSSCDSASDIEDNDISGQNDDTSGGDDDAAIDDDADNDNTVADDDLVDDDAATDDDDDYYPPGCEGNVHPLLLGITLLVNGEETEMPATVYTTDELQIAMKYSDENCNIAGERVISRS